MRRTILTLALAAGMVLGSASVALAHGNPPPLPAATGDPEQEKPISPFNADNAVFKKGLEKAKVQVEVEYFIDGESIGVIPSNRGIAQGYFAHSPTCVLHPDLSH